jgi:hypothetical protein
MKGMSVIDWVSILPIIARIVAPRILDAISNRLQSTPESERARLRKMLENLRNEVSRLASDSRNMSKSEMVERIREIQGKVDSDDYQEAMMPDAAGVVLESLQAAVEGKKAAIPDVLRDLRTLLNTWLHDLRFTGTLPEVQFTSD